MFTHSFRSSALFTGMVIGTAIFPSVASAQQSSADERADAVQATAVATVPAPPVSLSQAPVSGPVLAPAGVTRKDVAQVDLRSAQSPGEGVGSNRAMMGVGVVALVVGLIIGGDVGTLIAVGGAAVGLLGLYRYMQ